MVIKTLHWYILRELLRIFFLTASALTTLIAFCGTFKPLTKQGIGILQLMSYMMNLMPAMLAYAIPIASLFAAVLVYWRLSTDNELTACRASGISFVTMVWPAFILGFSLAIIDFGFVHYVVPVFLQRTEKAIVSDLGSLLVSAIGRQEAFKMEPFIVYADAASERPSTVPNSVVVVLDGVAVVQRKNRKPTVFICARQAIVTITSTATADGENQAEAVFQLIDGAAFDPVTFDRYSGSVDSLAGGGRIPIPSLLRDKLKFSNLKTLTDYDKDPTAFKPVQEIVDKIALRFTYETIGGRLLDNWEAKNKVGEPVVFKIPANKPGTFDELRIFAPSAFLDGEGQLYFSAIPANRAAGQPAVPMHVDVYGILPNGKPGPLQYTFNCSKASIHLGTSDLSKGTLVALQLHDVTSHDHIHNIPGYSGPIKELPAIELPKGTMDVLVPPPMDLLDIARHSKSTSMIQRYTEAYQQIQKLRNTIKSELHSRASFSVSCLTLVLFGAGLGILLRGKNPLAVFVMGLVPATILVLLITAGRQMAESASSKNVPIGVALIWGGNAVLLVLIITVYTKLLRT